jgi:hypothetical protein
MTHLKRASEGSMNININRIVSITSVIYLIFVFAFASGAIHAIIEGGRTGQQIFLIPDRSTQTLSESILGTMIFFLGLAGMYFIHKSTKPQTTKMQKTLFIAGFSIVGISLLAGFLLLDFKL